jgi:flagellar biosynthesis protein
MKPEHEKESPKAAVSLEYDVKKDRAPRITAKGRGKLAERIIALAKEHNIPIKSEPELVQVLYQLDLESEIPPALYRVVAEIFAFIYSLNKEWAGRKGA